MPNAPKSPCSESGCPETFVRKPGGPSKCPAHQKAKHRRIDEHRGSSHLRGYDRAWDILRVQAFIRDGWRCQSKACDIPGGWEPDLVRIYREMGQGLPSPHTVLDILRERYNAKQRHLDADHIIPFGTRPELRLQLSNIQTLCDPCHKAKSMKEMKEGLR